MVKWLNVFHWRPFFSFFNFLQLPISLHCNQFFNSHHIASRHLKFDFKFYPWFCVGLVAVSVADGHPIRFDSRRQPVLILMINFTFNLCWRQAKNAMKWKICQSPFIEMSMAREYIERKVQQKPSRIEWAMNKKRKCNFIAWMNFGGVKRSRLRTNRPHRSKSI